MTDTDKNIGSYETLLDAIEREILLRYENTIRFTHTPHVSKATRERQQRIENLDIDIITIRRGLSDSEWRKTEFADKAKELCRRCEELGKYTEKMHMFLANDLVERHRCEDKKTIDLVKYTTFAFGPPGVFLTAYAAGLGKEFINIYGVIVAGFAVSAGILCYKKVATGLGNIIKSEERELAAREAIQNRKEPTLGLGLT